MPATRERLIQLLIETRAFQYSPTAEFTLASGAKSRFYVDCRLAMSHPEARQVVGELMLDRIRDREVGAIGGLLVGALPVAIGVSDVAFRRGRLLRVFGVRKEAKGHGLKKVVEGDVRAGERVVIVEDVITSGKSTIDAIRKGRESGLVVTQVLAIVDRGEQNGLGNIGAEGVPVEALCTLADLERAATGTAAREGPAGPD